MNDFSSPVFRIDRVAEAIFSRLKLSDIVTCRQACPLWNQQIQAAPFIRRCVQFFDSLEAQNWDPVLNSPLRLPSHHTIVHPKIAPYLVLRCARLSLSRDASALRLKNLLENPGIIEVAEQLLCKPAVSHATLVIYSGGYTRKGIWIHLNAASGDALRIKDLRKAMAAVDFEIETKVSLALVEMFNGKPWNYKTVQFR